MFPVSFYLLLCVVFFLSLISSSQHRQLRGGNAGSVHFLGKTIHHHEWIKLKEMIHCWSKHGKWMKLQGEDEIKNKTYEYLSPCKNELNTRAKCVMVLYKDQVQWAWQAPNCPHPLLPFSTNGFCDIMAKSGGNLMLAGDSMTEHFGIAMMNAFYRNLTGVSCPQLCNRLCITKYEIPCRSQSLAKDNFNMLLYRNDYLTLVPSHMNRLKQISSFEASWLPEVSASKVRVLVLNRGAHYTSDDKLLNAVNESLLYVSKFFPRVSIVYRNTPHGYDEYLDTFDVPPLTEPPADNHLQIWNYHKFRHQNELVHDLIARHHPRVLHLDVFTPTVLRIDSHMDPLHYCSPGPVDLWPILLYNALSLIDRHPQGHPQGIHDREDEIKAGLSVAGNRTDIPENVTFYNSSSVSSVNGVNSSEYDVSLGYDTDYEPKESEFQDWLTHYFSHTLLDKKAIQGHGREVFFVMNGTKRSIPNFDTLMAMNISSSDYYHLEPSQVAAIPSGPSMPSLPYP